MNRSSGPRRSLRLRLGVAGALAIALALVLATVALIQLFERHVERRIGAELVGQVNQLAAAVQVTPDGRVQVQPRPVDPRFQTPLSGLYWQIDEEGVAGERRIGLLRSRSLWDALLDLDADNLPPGAVHAHRLEGPGGQRLLARERSILIETPASGQASMTQRLRLIAAIDLAELTAAKRAFAADILPYVGILALALGLATWIQIRAGLKPLEALRQDVNAIRAGAEQRLPEDYPSEVMPLISEMNAVLDARDQAVERSRAWTADLAHGLKTPLSALAADAERLRARGDETLAADLEELAESMRRRVDRELVRARIRASSGQRGASERDSDLIEALEQLRRTLSRTPSGESLDWRCQLPEQAPVAVPRDDLLELLGNLLENAVNWADSRIWIRVETPTRAGDPVSLWISDDGPGVPEEDLGRLGARGLRLDERREGTGLGLAIARDVAEAYGIDLVFGPGATHDRKTIPPDMGAQSGAVGKGLAVHLRLPAKT